MSAPDPIPAVHDADGNGNTTTATNRHADPPTDGKQPNQVYEDTNVNDEDYGTPVGNRSSLAQRASSSSKGSSPDTNKKVTTADQEVKRKVPSNTPSFESSSTITATPTPGFNTRDNGILEPGMDEKDSTDLSWHVGDETYAEALKDGIRGGETVNVDSLPSPSQPEINWTKANQSITVPTLRSDRDKDQTEDQPKEKTAASLYDEYPPLPATAPSRGQQISGWQAGAVKFAPWNIPYQRRLQTLAVLGHSLSIATTVSFFFLLCAVPLTWPLLIPYLLHMLLSKAATDGKLRFRSERFRRLPVWKFFGDYFPAKLHKTHDLPPTRKYIFGYHPHGIISHGAFAAFGTEALGFEEKFPGITNSLLTLESNFRIPIYREYVLALGLSSVSKESITNLLTRGGRNGEGMGKAVTIVIGGARESLEAHPGTMHLVLGERKGFVKMAIRTGADLVPVLAFGENDLYDQVSPKSHPRLHRIQMMLLRWMKFTLPFLHGRGIFNYDVGLMPYRRPLNIVVGKPIKVEQKSDEEFDTDEIDRLHREYVKELWKMWDRYKDEYAMERKEEMVMLK
ncbi:diacylglycerol acyltransferase-domain-containing protein [Bombardia bombarda]|uniref:diacylglycerol O-acyltransferase n=1 Tax=Bombardia bombarda TaxID=252184 RepID=A0AA39TMQ6_9PEZI|nr:diacylglycerol acyltransferase-domain-containing protein [Bombardia bombarda]